MFVSVVVQNLHDSHSHELENVLPKISAFHEFRDKHRFFKRSCLVHLTIKTCLSISKTQTQLFMGDIVCTFLSIVKNHRKMNSNVGKSRILHIHSLLFMFIWKVCSIEATALDQHFVTSSCIFLTKTFPNCIIQQFMEQKLTQDQCCFVGCNVVLTDLLLSNYC